MFMMSVALRSEPVVAYVHRAE